MTTPPACGRNRSVITILFYGDLVGRPGRDSVERHIREKRDALRPDIIIANGENSSGGIGLEPQTAEELFGIGIDVLTAGNHIWQKKDIGPYLDANQHRIVRPANFPPGAPGVGSLSFKTKAGPAIKVANLMGRVFMPQIIDCPFRSVDDILSSHAKERSGGAQLSFIDFHAEATSEKLAFGFHVDGRATAVVGTHTHVQTADERLLPKGTAYISDVGMCGARNSVIGFKQELVVERFITARPARFEVEKGELIVNAVCIRCDEGTGSVVKIERIVEIY